MRSFIWELLIGFHGFEFDLDGLAIAIAKVHCRKCPLFLTYDMISATDR